MSFRWFNQTFKSCKPQSKSIDLQTKVENNKIRIMYVCVCVGGGGGGLKEPGKAIRGACL